MNRITNETIDARAVVQNVQRNAAGAVLTFAGVVRDEHKGRKVLSIDYHGYQDMAEKEALRLEEEIRERWKDIEIFIAHRLGHLEIGEASVLIAVSSPHRDEGFTALRYAIDTLKERFPIWKHELYPDGEAWIEGS